MRLFCSARNAFKYYVKAILMRRNSITGVLYKDDPTIMAWDLANEPWVLGDDSGQTLTVSCPTNALQLSLLHCFSLGVLWSQTSSF